MTYVCLAFAEPPLGVAVRVYLESKQFSLVHTFKLCMGLGGEKIGIIRKLNYFVDKFISNYFHLYLINIYKP